MNGGGPNRRLRTHTSSFNQSLNGGQKQATFIPANFKREFIKDAHIGAVEHLKFIGHEQRQIELAFKEESNKQRSEVYEIYTNFVTKQLIFGKEAVAYSEEFRQARERASAKKMQDQSMNKSDQNQSRLVDTTTRETDGQGSKEKPAEPAESKLTKNNAQDKSDTNLVSDL